MFLTLEVRQLDFGQLVLERHVGEELEGVVFLRFEDL